MACTHKRRIYRQYQRVSPAHFSKSGAKLIVFEKAVVSQPVIGKTFENASGDDIDSHASKSRQISAVRRRVISRMKGVTAKLLPRRRRDSNEINIVIIARAQSMQSYQPLRAAIRIIS